MPPLPPEQLAACVKALEQLEPGFLPLEVFNAIARLVRLPTVQLIPIKEGPPLSIGIVKRDAEEAWWPNVWHFAGTVLRSTDTIESAIERLKEKELQLENSSPPVFRGVSVHHSTRGAEAVLIYTIADCSFKDSEAVGWFPANELPENFLESEKNVLAKLREAGL